MEGLFVHPVDDEAVMAGNGTIGLEILEDLPDLDAVVIPYGGGGLTVGIASAVQGAAPDGGSTRPSPRPAPRCVAALDAGGPIDVDYEPSFVDGAGSRRVLDPMWPRVQALIDDAVRRPDRRHRRGGPDAGRAGARDRRGRRGAGHRGRAGRAARARARSCASCPAATSTSPRWPRSSKEARDERARQRRRHRPRSSPDAGASDYERYLRTDELLSLQKTPEERVHRDELLFQTVHQTSELWLKFALARGRGGDAR